MKEDFLHYVWNFQKFAGELKTHSQEPLEIIQPGTKNQQAGPDFFNAQIILNNQRWAGNIEIHVRSSDWYAHHHEKDPHYDNVILHVVWQHDTDIYRKDNTTIPTLELKNYVDPLVLHNYQQLITPKKQLINCEKQLPNLDNVFLKNWFDRLYVERLQQKTTALLETLKLTNNNWEALLFVLLAKGFGLNLNGEAFYSLAQSVDFSVIKKCAHNPEMLEALLLGQAGLLGTNKQDEKYKELKEQYHYLKKKYQIKRKAPIKPNFFRLRPPNFPTIRLSQLAQLYSQKEHLFSQIIEAKNIEEFYSIFNIAASRYWDTHYNFEITSAKRKKGLTKKFINLLLINTIIPIKFCYAQQTGKDNTEELMSILSSMPREENSLITKFNNIKKIIHTALDSQAVIQLKNNYCDKNKCLQCSIGNYLLKTSH